MKELLKQIKDPELEKILNSIKIDDKDSNASDQFNKVKENYTEYDTSFLWLLSYQCEHSIRSQKYVECNYNNFKHFLDAGFPKKLVRKDCFHSHMWEMVLCDLLKFSGKLVQKSAGGADFLIETKEGVEVQIEATCPNEAEEITLRSEKPPEDQGPEEIFSRGGKIDDLELPILLRAIGKGFDAKSEKYDKNKPLIIAINTFKTVGMTSNDDYILRKMLFGLGNFTYTKKSDGTLQKGLEYSPGIGKPGEESFIGARFLNEENAHVSGVIYTSQNPLGLIPNSWGWSNSGIFFAPNPYATHKVNIDFPFFKKMICNEKTYRVEEEKEIFKGSFDF